jgi:hypothetical protein
MAKTPADKVADQLVELTENHFFNPAIFGSSTSETNQFIPQTELWKWLLR